MKVACRIGLPSLLFLLTTTSLCQKLPELDTDFIIELFERTEEPPGLQAVITSTKTYPCTGYQLRTTVGRWQDTISVTMIGMVAPSPCFPLPDEATGTAYIGNFAGGTTFLRFIYRQHVDLYFLSFEKKGTRVVPLAPHFTSIRWK